MLGEAVCGSEGRPDAKLLLQGGFTTVEAAGGTQRLFRMDPRIVAFHNEPD